MFKSLHLAVVAVVAALACPASATAAGIVLDSLGTGATGAWLPVDRATPTSVGTQGYWDRRSYDSASNSPVAACTAGMLVAGAPCDWARTSPATSIASPNPANPLEPLEYFGLTNALPGMTNAPLNFYLTGPFDFDWTVLFQLTDWDDTVEFGWYEAGNPDARTAIVGPGGPFTNNDGQPGVQGTANIPTGDFGFYYRNTRYGSSTENEILFFTESRFNRLGNYFAYFSDPESGIWPGPTRFDDELAFRNAVGVTGLQQFIIFRQGTRYWIGLEDQLGRITGEFCYLPGDQPCSDYDFNDFIIGMDQHPSVPEPAVLTLIGSALATAVWRRRRR